MYALIGRNGKNTIRKTATDLQKETVLQDGLLGVLTSFCVSQVTRLFEGTEYEFRVAALNSAGTGPFSGPSDSAFAVDPLSE